MEITLKDIIHEEQTSAAGKPYTRCKLIVASKDGGKDTWISGFGSTITKTWQAGDVVEVTTTQTDKGYWNFEENANTKPSKTATHYLKEISEKLSLLVEVSNIKGRLNAQTTSESTEVPKVAPTPSQTPPVQQENPVSQSMAAQGMNKGMDSFQDEVAPPPDDFQQDLKELGFVK